MKLGRDAVWEQDWQGSLGHYFRKDKKPDDFDRRVERIIARIDSEIAEKEETEAAAPDAPGPSA
jgi:hypothetical protein